MRALRDKQFLYVKNYIPYVPRGQHLDYQWKIPTQRIWEDIYKSGNANADQSRFFELKPNHELYDTSKAPYCLSNLAQSPEYQAKVEQFDSQLQTLQRSIYDAAFLPESELDRIAAQHGITVYEVLRLQSLYNIAAIQPVTDLALMQLSENVNQLTEYVSHRDIAIRYWAAVGLMMLGEQAAPASAQLNTLLNDDSHNVRLMAAWALINPGDTADAKQCIVEMANNDSYALLEILNVIDWMGEAGQPIIPQIAGITPDDKMLKMLHDYLLNGPTSFVDSATRGRKN